MGMYSAALFNSQAAEIEDFTQYVNPFIGTDYTGNTYPVCKCHMDWCS